MKRVSVLVIFVVSTAFCAVTTHFSLDTRLGPRIPAETEAIAYNPAWGDGSSVTIGLDGETIGTYDAAGQARIDTAGWSDGLHTLTHTAGGETLTARFTKLRVVNNLTAKQRYPWNGLVDIECDVAYSDPNQDLLVSFVATDLSTNLELPLHEIHCADGGNPVVKAGHRAFIWSTEADVLDKKIYDVALSVEAEIWPGGVQLWENGPYWAECNIGATKPEEVGYYFWWGGTEGYQRNVSNNGWVSVKDGAPFSFNSGNCPTDGMGNSDLRFAGYTDSMGNLTSEHDPAMVYLGAPWRMPTDAEWGALVSNCETTWTTQGGKTGLLVKGRGAYASQSIFLPASGRGNDSGLDSFYPCGYYWSSLLLSGNSFQAWYYRFKSGEILRSSAPRYYGYPVRPLRGFAE